MERGDWLQKIYSSQITSFGIKKNISQLEDLGIIEFIKLNSFESTRILNGKKCFENILHHDIENPIHDIENQIGYNI